MVVGVDLEHYTISIRATVSQLNTCVGELGDCNSTCPSVPECHCRLSRDGIHLDDCRCLWIELEEIEEILAKEFTVIEF